MTSASDDTPASIDADSLAYCLTRVAAGDPNALTPLYDRTCRLVYRAAFRVLRRDDEAEEVMLDVFAQVWRSAGTFRPIRGSVEGWLVMIAKSRALDRLRARQARPDVDLARIAELDGESLAEGPASPTEPISVDNRRRAARMLAMLLPHERELIELAFYEGFTHAELASRLDLPLGTVKTRIRNVLGKLRRTP